MPRLRELPRDFNPPEDRDGGDFERTDHAFVFIGGDSRRPLNAYQALMECEPFQEPDVSREERLTLRDLVCDALDDLNEQELWIFDALYVRRLSIRECGREISMPKTTVCRWRDRLLKRLRAKLEVEPLIAEYLSAASHSENG